MYCGPLLLLLLLRRLCRLFALLLTAKITDMDAAFHLMAFHQLKTICISQIYLKLQFLPLRYILFLLYIFFILQIDLNLFFHLSW